jgi:glycosyltransferase involved in cell wall biosynthesis
METNSLFKKVPSVFWYRYFSHRLINEENLDFFWSPLPILPKFISPNIRKIITVYDLNIYLVPHTMNKKSWLWYKLYFGKSVMEANKIITISKGTSQKLKKILNKNADVIVRPGVDRNVFHRKQIKKLFDFKYILSVSTLEARKNLETLVLAFLELKNEGLLRNIKLVLVGKNGWKNKNLLKLIKKFPEEIIYTGYISDEKLVNLYNGAEVFVYPSIYEGFGMPVLEARNCGCCVITTDIPELREACGEGCIYIQPNKQSLKKALKEFFYDGKKCKYSSEHIIDWDVEVKKFAKIFS